MPWKLSPTEQRLKKKAELAIRLVRRWDTHKETDIRTWVEILEAKIEQLLDPNEKKEGTDYD